MGKSKHDKDLTDDLVTRFELHGNYRKHRTTKKTIANAQKVRIPR